MNQNNTLAGYHFIKNEDGLIKVNTHKLYNWHIPKRLRKEYIQEGDIVLVPTSRGFRKVVVMNVFREELEVTGKKYKWVRKILERAPVTKIK